MHKRVIKYKNFSDEEKELTCYFHFGIPEMVEMELSEEGGLSSLIQRLIEEKEAKGIIDLVKRFVLEGYGVKSPDGERFQKSPEITHAFSQTAAYETLFVELVNDPEEAAQFINDMMPAEMLKEVEKQAEARRVASEAAGIASGIPSPSDILKSTEVVDSAFTVPSPPVAAPWSLPPSVEVPPPPPSFGAPPQ